MPAVMIANKVAGNSESQVSPVSSPPVKRQYQSSNEDTLKIQLTQAKSQLQALQVENEILKTQQKHTMQMEQRYLNSKNSDGRQSPMQLNEAVLKMEVEKLRFELQSRDRCISFLEERVRVEEEERIKINQLYSKRIDHEIATNDHLTQLKEVNRVLEQTLKQQKVEYQQHTKEEQAKHNQRMVHLQQELNEMQMRYESVAGKHAQLQDYIKALKDEHADQIEALQNEVKQNRHNTDQLDQIKQLQAENQQLRQTSLSFEAQRQFFEEEFKQLKEYYEEIVQENERLSEDLRHQNNSQDLLTQRENEIVNLREELMYYKQDSMMKRFTLPAEQDFQRLDLSRSLSANEVQQMADRFLVGQVDDLDLYSVKELKLFLHYFRDKILDLAGMRQQESMDINIQNDINEIKNYQRPIQYQTKAEEETESEIRALQQHSHELLGQIQERKMYLQMQEKYRVFSNGSEDDYKVIAELDQLYQEYDQCQVQIQMLVDKMQSKSADRRKSSVSFDQSFEVQNLDNI